MFNKSCGFHHVLNALVFSDVLTFLDICSLDTAVCNKDLRPKFLHILYSKLFKKNENFILGYNDPLQWIFKRQLSIQEISLFDGDDDTIMSMPIKCRNATVSLDLHGCRSISSSALYSISENFLLLSSLNLRGCDNITDSGITSILKTHPQLHSIHLGQGSGNEDFSYLDYDLTDTDSINDIQFAPYISDDILLSISENCHDIKCLHLYYCNKITDSGLSYVANTCKSLVSLELICCQLLSDISLSMITKVSKQLKHINLWRCCLVTDISLFSIAENCKDIETVLLGKCFRITKPGIVAIEKSCEKLKTLDLGHPRHDDCHCEECEIRLIRMPAGRSGGFDDDAEDDYANAGYPYEFQGSDDDDDNDYDDGFEVDFEFDHME